MRKKDKVEEIIENVKEGIDNPEVRKKPSIYTSEDLVPTGSTLLNLALSDNPDGGYRLGSINRIEGKKHGGKTLFILSMFAEVVRDKRFVDYFLKLTETEKAMFFDLLKMFGKGMDKLNISSPVTIQDWIQDIYGFWGIDKDFAKNVKKNKLKPSPLIEVIDSLDFLSCDSDLGDDRPTKGGYKTERPMALSASLPNICKALELSNSVMIFVSQVRATLNPFGEKEAGVGGNALNHACTLEFKITPVGQVKKTVRGQDIVVGSNIEIKVKKNKLTGKRRTITLEVIDQYGVNDIGSCIDWLIKYKFWGYNKGVIDPCGELDLEAKKRDELVKEIILGELESDFKKIIADCWYEIESELDSGIPPRYV